MNQQDFEATCASLGIDLDNIRSKATHQATQELMDKALYGFSARTTDGKRVDPHDLLPHDTQHTAAYYRARTRQPTHPTARQLSRCTRADGRSRVPVILGSGC